MAFLSLPRRFPILTASSASDLLSLCSHPSRPGTRYSFANVIAQGSLLAHSTILIQRPASSLLLPPRRRYKDAPVSHLQFWILNPIYQISEGENACSAVSSLQMRWWQEKESYTWSPVDPRGGLGPVELLTHLVLQGKKYASVLALFYNVLT